MNQEKLNLTQEQIDELKEQLLESIYADIGKSVVKKVLWILGAIALAGFTWMIGKGHV